MDHHSQRPRTAARSASHRIGRRTFWFLGFSIMIGSLAVSGCGPQASVPPQTATPSRDGPADSGALLRRA